MEGISIEDQAQDEYGNHSSTKELISGYWQDYSPRGRQERYGMKFRKEGEGAAKTKERLLVTKRLQNRYPTPSEILVVVLLLESTSLPPSKAPTPLVLSRGASTVEDTLL